MLCNHYNITLCHAMTIHRVHICVLVPTYTINTKSKLSTENAALKSYRVWDGYEITTIQLC